MDLFNLRQQVNSLLTEYKLAERQLQEEQVHLEAANSLSNALQQIQGIVQQLSQATQQRAHQRISSVVSSCLSAVFDDPYEFKIKFVQRRGKTEADLVFCRDGLELSDPLNELGGGVIDVAAFALRMACILLSKPKKRRLIVLDEPFKNIRGEENKKRTKDMLIRMANEMGIQVIINTDIPSYQLGTIVELE